MKKKQAVRKLVLSKETLMNLDLATAGEAPTLGKIDEPEPTLTLCNSYCSGGPGC